MAGCSDATVRPGDPCTIVIFGGSGDLAKRKLLPSLYNMARNGILPEHCAVVGTGGTPYSDEKFRARFADAVHEFCAPPVDEALLRRLTDAAYYQRGRFIDPGEYDALVHRLDDLDAGHQTAGNRLYYLATPPDYFGTIAALLGTSGLVRRPGDRAGWTRIVVEKPFGRDLDSARALNRALLGSFDERQVFRIDHYLGKETVQNILMLRFANGIFEPIWNRRYVDHVQITVAETLGVEGRGAYYETAGALRDVLQNHVFQLLCLVAMEPPFSLDAEAIRNEKVKVLHAIRPLSPDDIRRDAVRGQYAAGTIDGRPVAGYRQEPHVSASSETDTYAALRLEVENWRWADVPFYVRTGKRLAMRDTQIVIQFKRAPLALLRGTADEPPPNRLTIHVQPDERITLRFHAKCPGPAVRLVPVAMAFAYGELEGASSRSTGYETLLYDVMIGDQSLFHRDDMVEAAWALATPILRQWEHEHPDLPNYAAGTWGPAAADALLARDGRSWLAPGADT